MDDSEFEIDTTLSSSPISFSPAQQKQTNLPHHPKPSQQSSKTTGTDRESHMQTELATLRRMNTVVENLTSSLQTARRNMQTVNATVAQSSALLDTWTRILNQAEHNQRLILNPAWQGASADIADAENEALNAARDRERRAAEEARKKQVAEEARQRRLEEEERRRAEGATTPVARGSTRGRTTAGRTRGTAAGRGLARSQSQSQRFAPTEEEERKDAAQRARARARAATMHYGRVRGKRGA